MTTWKPSQTGFTIPSSTTQSRKTLWARTWVRPRLLKWTPICLERLKTNTTFHPPPARINARISKEISHALPQSLPQSLPPPSSTDDDQWTPVVIYDAMLRVVSVASGSAFLGPGLCRDETYLATAAACARDAMGAVRALKRWPSWLRGPAVRLGLEPAAARFRSHRPKMRAFLGPVYEERKRLMERGDPLPDDAFQWMMSRADAEGVMDVDSLSHMLLILALAAIHATVHMVTELFVEPHVSCPPCCV